MMGFAKQESVGLNPNDRGLGPPGPSGGVPSHKCDGVPSRAEPWPSLPLLLAGALATSLVLLPIVWTVAQAFGSSLAEARDMLLRPLVGELLLNTLLLVLTTTAVSAVIGTLTAWCIERTDLPGRRAWALLAAAPLAIPPFISSYGWVSLSTVFQGFWGAAIVVGCAYTPLVVLPVAAALRGMDPALEESARALGCGGVGCFWRVVLPQLRPALMGGALLVCLNTLVEFGAFALMRFRTFTTELYAEYRVGMDGSQTALLACVLILLCLGCLGAELRLRGRMRYAAVGRVAGRRMGVLPLGSWRWPVLALLALNATACLGVPLGMTLYWLTRHNAAAVTTAGASWPLVLDAAANSVGLGLAGAALTLLLALPLGVLASRHEGRLVAALERLAWLAQGVPGIVVALALVSATLTLAQPLYQTSLLLVLAYAILFLPLALVSVRAALLQSRRGLEEAGRSLGLGWAAAAWRVTLPLAAPGLAAAAALVFVSVVTELTTTLLLSPIGTETLATQVWANSSTLAYAAAAPYAACMVGLSMASTWLLVRRVRAVAPDGRQAGLLF